MHILWIILIGFVAGVLAKLVTPGDNEPQGFILTTVLGIVGAFVATYLGQAIGCTARIKVRDSLERSWAQYLYCWSGALLFVVAGPSSPIIRYPSSLAYAAVLAFAAVLTLVCSRLDEANAASRLDYETKRDAFYWRQYAYPRPNCTFAISEFQRRWSSQLWPPSMRCRPYPH
jgi:uncharacterized membrane protein YeaQ/YmgE (transglycosylase-associated protein family)